MESHVRRATPQDAASLARIEVSSWRAAYRGLMPDMFLDQLSEAEKTEMWLKNLLKHQASERKRVLVACTNVEVIGFTRVGLISDENPIGLVYLLYVLPAYWGRGVGTALMNGAMEELRDLGRSEAVLWVLRDNDRARRFYEGLGWCQDGQVTSEEYDGVVLEALCYQKSV